jgi:hypothetical protein
MFSDDVINELRDRVADVFAPLDEQTRLTVEHVMRKQLGIPDVMSIDVWELFVRRLYVTASRIEAQVVEHRKRENRRTCG